MVLRILALLLFSDLVYGQPPPVQRYPENGANGYNGSTPRSFIIQWDTLEAVSYYEYVLSDNSLCFAGCSGDTRHDKVVEPYAIESNLMLNKWYYWIVRAIMKNGDTTFYSVIHSFYTSPRPEDFRSYFTLSPSLISAGNMDIRIAWTIDPDINDLDYKIYNSFGQLLFSSSTINLKKNELEQTEILNVNLEGYGTGLYFMEINTNRSKVPERVKFLVSQ